MSSIANWILNHWFTQEKFWVALGSAITAIALVYTITRNNRNHQQKKNNLIKSLQVEIITNVESIFSGGVDRPLLFDAMRTLRKEFVSEVKNMETLGKLQRLYLELEHYSNFVSKVYLNNSGIDARYVTERQLMTDNIFLAHFGQKQIKYDIDKLNHADIGRLYIEERRDEAIKIKEADLTSWKKQLDAEIETLF